ncbi:MAG: DUF3052 family protein [Ignavibacteriales bacterium]|nr:DUF3052 family protein [Ignavibacteriales bacterium]
MSLLARRPKERDYSHRALIDKLGVKEVSKVSVIGVDDAEFLKQLHDRASDISFGRLARESDFVFFSADSTLELKKLRNLKRFLKMDGAIWIVSLKGKLARIKDLDVMRAAKSAGLVDNKVVGFSETHTSLKLVIPLAKRPR